MTVEQPSTLYRVVLLAFAVVAFSLAMQSSIVRFLDLRAPDAALRVSPGDAVALSGKATASFAAGVRDPAQLAVARRYAERALARDLTRDDALFVLAATDSGPGAERRATGLIEQAERLSRRNLAAELWLIENAVRRQDVAGALHHFDAALRTNPIAGEMLFPILRNALEDSALVGPIALTLNRAPWRGPFLQYAVSLDRPSVRLAAVMAHQKRLAPFQGTDLKGALVSQLVAAKSFDAAAYLALGSNAGLVQDADFADKGGYPPFTWQLTDSPGLVARRLEDGATPQLQVQADDGAAGVVATQLIHAGPGPYVMAAGMATDVAGLMVHLTCASDPRELATMPVGPKKAMTVAIPPACPYQRLDLVVSPNGEGSREWRVTRLDLLPSEQASK